MLVRDTMTPSPSTCDPSTSARLVAQLMIDHDCAMVPVCSSGVLVGVITDRDLACRLIASGKDPNHVTASELMTKPVITIAPDDPFEKAVELMEENTIHHLPVIKPDGVLVGIVAQSDLGRRMSNRELGQLARETSVRSTHRVAPGHPLTPRTT